MQWEVEALDPTELQRLVLAAIVPYIDNAVLADRIAEEERQRRRLRTCTEGWAEPSRSPNGNRDGSANGDPA
ncbi:hypothetical protein [Streptomyces flaveus]|uniref:Uncharacterized protein n=1 Tax=Streptomyces flaveus TaxID=66370 RepID=A0A917QRH6_9ACTN|nr:hypothetical protein [Streptomyces flaveus]GGK64327.1 hypothetical protein GCM10010094_26600 [Streptomyces flaveus]